MPWIYIKRLREGINEGKMKYFFLFLIDVAGNNFFRMTATM